MNRYSVGYNERTARFFQERTADTHAQFLLKYLWTPDAESARRNAHFLAELCGDSEFSDQLVEYGLADKRVLAQLKSSFLTWGEMPEAFAAEAWGELVARKA